jgi:hypothetical protein
MEITSITQIIENPALLAKFKGICIENRFEQKF